MSGNGNGGDDRAAWAETGKAMADALRMREEDVLGELSLNPARAAGAISSLFEATVDHIEHPLPIEQGMTEAEIVQCRREDAESIARFWEILDALSAKVTTHPARPG